MPLRDPQKRREYQREFYATKAQRTRRSKNQQRYIRRQRERIFDRDRFTCAYCREVFTYAALTVDHKTPRARGGADTDENKTTACKPCNQKKGKMTSDEYLAKIGAVPTWVTEEN